MSVVKICLLGDGGVGKTALAIQLVFNHFALEYDPTIEDNYRKQVKIDEEVCILEILDTAGQEEYSCMRPQWIRGCEGFITVYDLTNKGTFEEIQKFVDQIERVKNTKVRQNIMLCGNKSDLESQREVKKEDGEEKAKEMGLMFSECSAKSRDNIEEVFYDIVRGVRKFKQQNPKACLKWPVESIPNCSKILKCSNCGEDGPDVVSNEPRDRGRVRFDPNLV